MRVRSCVRVRSRAGADDALIRGMCASATRSVRKAIHLWNTHIHSVVRPRAASVRLGARVRVRLGARASAPTHASAFRRRRPRVARLAGVQLCVGFQREHRRVGHRVSHRLVQCMRRPFGPGGGPPRAGRAPAGCSIRRGPLCAAAPPMRARVCFAQTCGRAHARASPCADIAARSKDGLHVCMHT
jgi:hypothetical protein